MKKIGEYSEIIGLIIYALHFFVLKFRNDFDVSLKQCKHKNSEKD